MKPKDLPKQPEKIAPTIAPKKSNFIPADFDHVSNDQSDDEFDPSEDVVDNTDEYDMSDLIDAGEHIWEKTVIELVTKMFQQSR